MIPAVVYYTVRVHFAALVVIQLADLAPRIFYQALRKTQALFKGFPSYHLIAVSPSGIMERECVTERERERDGAKKNRG
jgi:hypothetical protein